MAPIYLDMKSRKLKPLNPAERKQVSRIANRAINRKAETKHHNIYDAGSSVTTTPAVVSLTDIAQGDTDTTRDGDQLHLYRFDLRGHIIAADLTNVVRFIVFQWKPATLPAATDILFDVVNNGVDAPYNLDKAASYNILKDRRFNMGTNGGSGQALMRVKLSGKKLGNKTVRYTGGGTTGTNKIYFLRMSDSGASLHPVMYYYVKLSYKDM